MMAARELKKLAGIVVGIDGCATRAISDDGDMLMMATTCDDNLTTAAAECNDDDDNF